jgi:hypothetical protein
MPTDKRTTELTAATSIADTDLVPIVQDVATVPTTKRTAWTLVKSNLKKYFDTVYAALIHASRHKSGGADAITLDELATPTDVTTLNASTSYHGLLPKLSGVSTEFLNGLGSWATPAGGSAGSADGWTAAGETWTYVSASQIKVTGADVTAKYQKGTKLKFTQTATKYAVVTSSSLSGSDTLIDIAINIDYTIANATITNPYYSYSENPQGWPDWFNFTSAISNETDTQPTLGNGTLTSRYRISGHTLTGWVKLVWGSSSAAGTGVRINFLLPVAASASVSLNTTIGVAKVLDSGTQEYTAMTGLQTTTKIRLYNAGPAVAAALSWNTLFTPATADEWTAAFSYEM